MLSLGIDEHTGKIVYARDVDINQPYHPRINQIIKRPKISKEIKYLMEKEPNHKLEISISFNGDNANSIRTIIEEHHGVLLSAIEGIHVAQAKINAGDIKNLIEEQNVNYVN